MSNPKTVIRRKRGLLTWAKAAVKKLLKAGKANEAAELVRMYKKVRLVGRMGKPARALLADFQRRHKLSPTGVWNAATVRLMEPYFPKPAFGAAVIKAARAQVGAHEVPAGSNRGPAVNKFFGVGWGGVPGGSGWCTFFAAWCWQEALETLGSDVKLSKQLAGVYMPATSSVLTAAKNGNAHLKCVTKPKRGDWVCMEFDNVGALDHSGIYWRRSTIPGYEVHIEGNTSSDDAGSQSNGGCVAIKRRPKSVVRGYVRYVA